MIVITCSASFAEDVVRIGVLRFDSKADGISQRNAESITDELTKMLANSYSIAIIDSSHMDAIAREHRMTLAGLIDPRTAAQIGHFAGIQFLITGSITSFNLTEEIQKNDSRAFWELVSDRRTADLLSSQSIEKTENAEVTLNVHIIDINTREVVLSMAETGKATRKSTIKSGSGNSANANIQNVSLRDAAVSDAVARIGHRIKEAVAGEYPQVLRANGEEIIISIGATSGAKVGSLYKVSLEGEEILDMRGKVIGRTTTTVAIIRIDNVKNDYSVASVVKNGGNPSNIRRGDRVEQSSEAEMKELIKKRAFYDRRPRKQLNEQKLSDTELDIRVNDAATQYTVTPEEMPEREKAASQTINASSATSDIQQRRPTKRLKLENHSTDTAKVIASYAMSDEEKNRLKENHMKAEKMRSREEKFDRYVEMFNGNPSDYFAAYQAGKTAFDFGSYSRAYEWAEKALAVNPYYGPAKRLSKAAMGMSSK